MVKILWSWLGSGKRILMARDWMDMLRCGYLLWLLDALSELCWLETLLQGYLLRCPKVWWAETLVGKRIWWHLSFLLIIIIVWTLHLTWLRLFTLLLAVWKAVFIHHFYVSLELWWLLIAVLCRSWRQWHFGCSWHRLRELDTLTLVLTDVEFLKTTILLECCNITLVDCLSLV